MISSFIKSSVTPSSTYPGVAQNFPLQTDFDFSLKDERRDKPLYFEVAISFDLPELKLVSPLDFSRSSKDP